MAMSRDELKNGILQSIGSGRTKTKDAEAAYSKMIGFSGIEVTVAFGMILQEMVTEGLVEAHTAAAGRGPDIIAEVSLRPKGKERLR